MEDHVRRVAGRLGDGRRVDHRVVAAHDREGRARVGQVGLHVRGLSRVGALEDGRSEVGRCHVVPGREQGVDGGAADLARPPVTRMRMARNLLPAARAVSAGPQPVAGGSCRRITLLRLRRLRLRTCPPPPARAASLPLWAPASASRSAGVYFLRGRSSCAGLWRGCSPPEYRAAVVCLRLGEPTVRQWPLAIGKASLGIAVDGRRGRLLLTHARSPACSRRGRLCRHADVLSHAVSPLPSFLSSRAETTEPRCASGIMALHGA